MFSLALVAGFVGGLLGFGGLRVGLMGVMLLWVLMCFLWCSEVAWFCGLWGFLRGDYVDFELFDFCGFICGFAIEFPVYVGWVLWLGVCFRCETSL